MYAIHQCYGRGMSNIKSVMLYRDTKKQCRVSLEAKMKGKDERPEIRNS